MIDLTPLLDRFLFIASPESLPWLAIIMALALAFRLAGNGKGGRR